MRRRHLSVASTYTEPAFCHKEVPWVSLFKEKSKTLERQKHKSAIDKIDSTCRCRVLQPTRMRIFMRLVPWLASHFWCIGIVNNLSQFFQFLAICFHVSWDCIWHHVILMWSIEIHNLCLSYLCFLSYLQSNFYPSCWFYTGLFLNLNVIRLFLIFIALNYFAFRNKRRHWHIHKSKKLSNLNSGIMW